MNHRILILFIVISIGLYHTSLAQNYEPKLHGYIQSRFSTDFENTNDFMIRRAKLWVDGNAPGLDYISYKIQAVYRSFADEAVMLQDAFADIKFDRFGILRGWKIRPRFYARKDATRL